MKKAALCFELVVNEENNAIGNYKKKWVWTRLCSWTGISFNLYMLSSCLMYCAMAGVSRVHTASGSDPRSYSYRENVSLTDTTRAKRTTLVSDAANGMGEGCCCDSNMSDVTRGIVPLEEEGGGDDMDGMGCIIR